MPISKELRHKYLSYNRKPTKTSEGEMPSSKPRSSKLTIMTKPSRHPPSLIISDEPVKADQPDEASFITTRIWRLCHQTWNWPRIVCWGAFVCIYSRTAYSTFVSNTNNSNGSLGYQCRLSLRGEWVNLKIHSTSEAGSQPQAFSYWFLHGPYNSAALLRCLCLWWTACISTP